MQRSFFAPASSRHQRGLSIMEVLIGMTIGLICALAVFQALMAWNSRSRSTTAGSDAQVAGTLAMYYLDRDFRLAGMGFGMAEARYAGCPVTTTDATFSPPMAAVTIEKDASGETPDVLRVMYGNSSFMVVGQPFDAATANSKQARSRAGFNVGDRFVAAGVNSAGAVFCRLLEMTGISTPDDSKTLLHQDSQGPYVDSYGNTRTTSATNNTSTWSGSNITGRLFNLGPAPTLAEWRVVNGALTRVNRLAINANTGLVPVEADLQRAEVSQGIADFQAQYGYDANGNDRIEDGEWINTLPTPVDWTLVRAIRIGLLVRSQQYELEAVYGTDKLPTPTWADGANTFTMRDVGGVADTSPANANNWRHYRYRMYESVIPLRNMIWGNTAPLG